MWKKKCIFAFRNMKRSLLILLYLSAAMGARGQYTRLAGDPSHTALYLDAGRIWNYNLYEHSRWGGGLMLTTHPSNFIFSQIDAEGYLGYGTYDQRWKYGAALDELIHDSPFHSALYQRIEHDYFTAGSRHIANPWSRGQLLGGFMSHRMTEESLVTFGYRWNTQPWRWAVEFTWGERRCLFNETNLLYAKQDLMNYERFGRLRLLIRHSSGFAAQYEYLSDWKTMRLLADFRRSIPLSILKLDLYAQGGVTPKGNRYIDLFDLGGFFSAPLYLERGFSTIRPNEFTSNTFASFYLRLQTAAPFFKSYNPLFGTGTNPSPFFSINALWGMLWNQDENGQRPWLVSYLQAPNRGLLEVSLGIDGIIRYGVTDWGVAVAYRITSPTAAYHNTDARHNIAILITAKLTD